MERMYLDHAATTPVRGEVLQAMLPYFSEIYGNANSLHWFGRRAACATDDARDGVAACIGAMPSEVYFTSGGTEADNWALCGAARANAAKGRHIVVSAIEHAAVLAAAKQMEAEGFEVAYAPVDADGRADLSRLEALLRPDTTLVAVMAANNEVGTLQPVSEISALVRPRGILLFCDAVQAAGVLPLDVNAPAVDLLSLSAHKFGGPKGVGALYVRSGVKMGKLVAGGHQERGMRGGTTNVPAVVGLCAALRLVREEQAQTAAHLAALRDAFVGRVLRGAEGAALSGAGAARLPGIAHLTFAGLDGEAILYSLDLAGVAASAGAACSSGSLEPSHVLRAMGMPDALARSGVRFSFGKENTEREAERAADILIEVVARLRALGGARA